MLLVLCLVLAAHVSSIKALSSSTPYFRSSRLASMDNKFEQRRDAVLDAISCGADRSKKGSFDAPIADMLCHLNHSPDYVSTSSCSGRVAVFWESTAEAIDADASHDGVDADTVSVQGARRRAKGGQWLLCKHGEVTLDEVEAAIAKASPDSGIAFFKHEPFVLHVQCRSVEAACQLMEVARAGGFRESGISIGKKHIIVGIRTSALKIEAPVLEDGNSLITPEYLKVLVRLANSKFAKNRDKTDRFYSLLKQSILKSVPIPDEVTDASSRPASEEAGCGSSPPGEIDSSPWAVTCLPSECESVRSLLVRAAWLDKTHRNLKLPSGRMAIPVTAECAAALGDSSGASSLGEDAARVSELLTARAATLEVVEGLQPAGKASKPSPAAVMAASMRDLLEAAGAAGVEEAVRGVPKKWEEYGDLVLLPEGSLQGGVWSTVDQRELWRRAAASLGAGRVACKAEVDAGEMRESHVEVKHPPGASGWVSVVQHGLSYTFDITRVMFSRGNVNERRRMGKVAAAGETVVDLFAGIGYFTVPLLASAGVQQLYACEWNPASVQALRKNLQANGVAERCTVMEGDNKLSAPQLEGCADRVLLGLLPSSEGAWVLAVRCLKAAGGWLHVHENVAEADMEAWKSKLQREVQREAKEAGREWEVEIRHVEFVKTYAPRVWHVVVDVECRAA